ncbi:hypothetical protein PUN28_016129 [Cardiocondyla obscurior]|uniref:Secreted protein n=1 Tax=Cardiocondyla obscurior TaxID=286306 RepID=A0AAW2ETM0_9HYME
MRAFVYPSILLTVTIVAAPRRNLCFHNARKTRGVALTITSHLNRGKRPHWPRSISMTFARPQRSDDMMRNERERRACYGDLVTGDILRQLRKRRYIVLSESQELLTKGSFFFPAPRKFFARRVVA